jgi:hypothetical protein
VLATALQKEKYHTQHRKGDECPQRYHVIPAMFSAACDAISQREHRARSGNSVEHVKGAGAGFFLTQNPGAGKYGQADWDIDEEHPSPAKKAGQHTTQQNATWRATLKIPEPEAERERIRHSRLKLLDRYIADLTTTDKNQREALTVATLN